MDNRTLSTSLATDTSHPSSAPALKKHASSAFSWRALLTGLACVIAIAAITPYNDFLLQNTKLIGNHFPIGIMTLMMALLLVINPALARLKFRPFAKQELIVILTMMLIGAAAPSSGLIRYLEPIIMAPATVGESYPWLKPIIDLIPHALLPARDPASPLITNYALGIDTARHEHVPWLAFFLPGLLWGILAAAIMGGSFFLAAIFRKQWVHHERLTFPLATIPLELMATPEEGKLYNALWRNPVLWAGAAIPLLVYFLKGMHAQFPGVPDITLQYDMRAALTDPPWDALPTWMAQAQVFFAAVGICFFVPSEIAFSLWFFLVLNGALRVFFARTSFDPGAHENERAIGSSLAYFVGLLWLARGHFRFVLAAAWKKSPRAEDEPLSYRTMLIGLVACAAVAFLWLTAVGMQPAMALLLLAIGTMMLTLMARIVAETGLFFVNPSFWANDFFTAMISPAAISKASMLWTQVAARLFFADLRESLMPFAANALRMGQELHDRDRLATANTGAKWVRWLALSLFISTLVSAAAYHWLTYTHGHIAMNDGSAGQASMRIALQDTFSFHTAARENSLATAWGHLGAGSLLAAGLMAGRMLWAGWPFHPIGLVLMNSASMHALWFSIFLGWGTKRLLLRYGGVGGFPRARPFFIGLIVGETLAAGIWMFLGLASHGVIKFGFLPG